MAARILIVDDDPAGLLALSEALQLRLHEGRDIRIESSLSAADGLMRLSQGAYDLIICDVRLPGMDGLALLKQTRDTRPDVPVVLVTAAGLEQEEQALYGGAYAFIEKPIDIDHFLMVVEQALDRVRLAQRVRESNFNSVSRLETLRRVTSSH